MVQTKSIFFDAELLESLEDGLASLQEHQIVINECFVDALTLQHRDCVQSSQRADSIQYTQRRINAIFAVLKKIEKARS